MCFNMEEIIKLDTVGLYNKLYGVETLHPLVSVVDASEIKQDLPANVTLNYGLYALYLKQTKCGDLRYGRQLYDYQEGTVTSFAPGKWWKSVVTRMSVRNGRGWCFIPI